MRSGLTRYWHCGASMCNRFAKSYRSVRANCSYLSKCKKSSSNNMPPMLFEGIVGFIGSALVGLGIQQCIKYYQYREKIKEVRHSKLAILRISFRFSFTNNAFDSLSIVCKMVSHQKTRPNTQRMEHCHHKSILLIHKIIVLTSRFTSFFTMSQNV